MDKISVLLETFQEMKQKKTEVLDAEVINK